MFMLLSIILSTSIFCFKSHPIYLMLMLEGTLLFYLLLFNISNSTYFLFNYFMVFLVMVVLSGAFGLCLLSFILRHFYSSNFCFLNLSNIFFTS